MRNKERAAFAVGIFDILTGVAEWIGHLFGERQFKPQRLRHRRADRRLVSGIALNLLVTAQRHHRQTRVGRMEEGARADGVRTPPACVALVLGEAARQRLRTRPGGLKIEHILCDTVEFSRCQQAAIIVKDVFLMIVDGFQIVAC